MPLQTSQTETKALAQQLKTHDQQVGCRTLNGVLIRKSFYFQVCRLRGWNIRRCRPTLPVLKAIHNTMHAADLRRLPLSSFLALSFYYMILLKQVYMLSFFQHVLPKAVWEEPSCFMLRRNCCILAQSAHELILNILQQGVLLQHTKKHLEGAPHSFWTLSTTFKLEVQRVRFLMIFTFIYLEMKDVWTVLLLIYFQLYSFYKLACSIQCLTSFI